VAARLRHVAGTTWGSRCYLDMSRLQQPPDPETEPTLATKKESELTPNR
jgi:hypothetical protein